MELQVRRDCDVALVEQAMNISAKQYAVPHLVIPRRPHMDEREPLRERAGNALRSPRNRGRRPPSTAILNGTLAEPRGDRVSACRIHALATPVL